MRATLLPLSLILSQVVAVAHSVIADDREPTMWMTLDAPIKTWDEAVPLGNGLTGGLLWGQDNKINLSLDRGDLWDERLPELYLQDNWTYQTIRELKAAGNQKEISRLFDAPYNMPYPTKLPGGRLVLTLDPRQKAKKFELDMRQAIGRVDLAVGALETFFCATEPVAMLRIKGPPPKYEFLRPAGLDRLGYQPAEFGSEDDVTWMVQEAALGLKYAVVLASRRVEGETQLAIAITSTNDGDSPLALGKKRVASALDAGYDKLFESHREWWDDFWAISSVDVPNERIQRHYSLMKYFYGAASRPSSPPMPLQGVWTRDDGGLPPWKGDYHHDLNTQMTYFAYPTAGLFDSGKSFINFNWDLLPTYRKFAREFYAVDGAAVPGVSTLAGKPTAGWSQYALSPANGLWVGQSFYLHWRYTMDREFLQQRAYPWLSEIATGIVNLMDERDGKLYLPLSSSPEIHNNSLRAWLEPNSNNDLALIQWTFEALAEMADTLGRKEDVAQWRKLRSQLDDPLVDDQKVLMFARGEPFNQSHRHHSQAMAIHPLGTLNLDGNENDRAIIDATLDRMHQLGTRAWCGYSFSWFSCMLARCGRADMALDYLIDYERAFILRNGFHANGDQIGAGLSNFRYRPFTLEGNFLAMQAVHEMLLQSWGGTVRVFPAVSDRWGDLSFSGLRTEGGFKVSAKRVAGQTTEVRIEATVDGPLRLRDPFGGTNATWNRLNVRQDGNEYVITLKKGDVLTGARK